MTRQLTNKELNLNERSMRVNVLSPGPVETLGLPDPGEGRRAGKAAPRRRRRIGAARRLRPAQEIAF